MAPALSILQRCERTCGADVGQNLRDSCDIFTAAAGVFARVAHAAIGRCSNEVHFAANENAFDFKSVLVENG